MKKIIIISLLFSSCFSKNDKKDIILNISSSYSGLVYLVSSNVSPQTQYTLTKDNHGIVYVAHEAFEKEKILRIQILETGKFIEKPIKTNRNEFYPEYRTRGITYYEFAFPVDSIISKDSLYPLKINGETVREVDEFQYYYYTGIIDTSKIYY